MQEAKPPGDTTMRLSDAAAVLGISRQRVHKLVQNGILPARRVYGMWRVEERDVLRRKQETEGTRT